MNALTHSNGHAVAVAGDKNFFEAYGDAVSRSKIVGDLLKFSKGEYLFGQNGDEMDEGHELVANLDELMVGWIKWVDGKPEDTIMGRVVDGHVPASRSSLGDTDKDEWEADDRGDKKDPWQLTNYLVMKEPDSDKLYTFTTSSKGGMSAVGRLCAEYGKRIRSKPNEFPIVALGVDSYKHSNKAYGKIFTPDFEIVGWVDKGSFADAMAAESEAKSDEKEDEPALPMTTKGGKASKNEARF